MTHEPKDPFHKSCNRFMNLCSHMLTNVILKAIIIQFKSIYLAIDFQKIRSLAFTFVTVPIVCCHK